MPFTQVCRATETQSDDFCLLPFLSAKSPLASVPKMKPSAKPAALCTRTPPFLASALAMEAVNQGSEGRLASRASGNFYVGKFRG